MLQKTASYMIRWSSEILELNVLAPIYIFQKCTNSQRCSRKNNLTWHVTDREAGVVTVIHSRFDAQQHPVLWIYTWSRFPEYACDGVRCILFIPLHTIYHSAYSKLGSKLPDGLDYTLPSMLCTTLLNTRNCTLPAWLTVCSKSLWMAHSQHTWLCPSK